MVKLGADNEYKLIFWKCINSSTSYFWRRSRDVVRSASWLISWLRVSPYLCRRCWGLLRGWPELGLDSVGWLSVVVDLKKWTFVGSARVVDQKSIFRLSAGNKTGLQLFLRITSRSRRFLITTVHDVYIHILTVIRWESKHTPTRYLSEEIIIFIFASANQTLLECWVASYLLLMFTLPLYTYKLIFL